MAARQFLERADVRSGRGRKQRISQIVVRDLLAAKAEESH
jgi:hypothetical protein